MMKAVVFAGGRGTRLGLGEKPLVNIKGKPMIEYVVEALSTTPRIDEIIIVVTKYTPNTIKWCISRGIDYIMTKGIGYEYDVAEVIELVKPPFLVLPSDIPLIQPSTLETYLEVVDDIGVKCTNTLLIPLEDFKKYASQESLTPIEYLGNLFQPSGISLIGLTTSIWRNTITGMKKDFINVNTFYELRIVEEILDETHAWREHMGS